MALRTEKQATEKIMARMARRMWSLAGGEALTFMARKLATPLARTSAPAVDSPARFAWVRLSSVRRRLVFPELGLGGPQQQRHDQQDGQPAGDTHEAIETRHDAVGRRGPLD